MCSNEKLLPRRKSKDAASILSPPPNSLERCDVNNVAKSTGFKDRDTRIVNGSSTMETAVADSDGDIDMIETDTTEDLPSQAIGGDEKEDEAKPALHS